LTDSHSHQIIDVLREIGTEKCLAKANALSQESIPMRSLHLRDFGLSAAHVIAVASCLKANKSLKSISLSYNKDLGDSGAIALSQQLPNHITEVGLVNCGIGDAGGAAILRWMDTAQALQMICMEQNSFSNELKSAFRKFSADNPQTLVVI